MKKDFYDAIVIGSGLGGLSAGATLSVNGKRVLILEQHSLIGGCATCFKRKGMLVDAGLHEMDFGDPRTDMKHHIFRYLGIDKRVEFISLPSAWSIVESDNPDSVITIPHSNTKYMLIKAFPHEKSGINKYFRKINFQAFLVRRFPFDMNFINFFFAPITTLVFLTYNMLANKNTGSVLNSIIKDHKLKRILNINISYYHHNPFKFIWSYHAIPQKHYYDGGVYIKGGSQKLSNSFSDIIKEHGGDVRANSDVIEILLEGKKAVGVEYIDTKSNRNIKVYANTIIANCDPHIVYSSLLKNISSNFLFKDINTTKDFSITSSLVSIYMIFNRNISEVYPNMDYSTFIVESKYFNRDFTEGTSDSADVPIHSRDIAFINYSKIDNGLSDRDDRFLCVGAIYSNYEEWDLPPDEYKHKKKLLQDIIVKRIDHVYPNIMDYCIHIEIATPKTVERYTRTRKGAIYGYDQNIDGFIGRERFKSKTINNLYFASSFGFPGGGFTGAILGGYRVARKILDPYFYVKKIILCFIVGICITILIKNIIL